MDRYAQMSDIQALGYAQMSDIKKLEARVKALESAQNLQQQSAAPAVKDSLTVHFATDDRQIGSSADTGLLPMIVSETGSDDEPEIERIICSSISGGADYVNGMPRELSLQRIRYGDLHLGSAFFSARYVQAPPGVTEPTPAPAGGLVERVRDAMLITQSIEEIARAAIREVADWLEQQQEVPIGSTASAAVFAAMLRSEAN